MATFSITRRLIASVIFTQILLTVAVVSLATYLGRRQLRTSFDAALQGRAMSIAALVRFSEDARPHLIFDSSLVPPPRDPEHPDLYRIFAADGSVLGSAPGWPADFLSTGEEQHSYWTVQQRRGQYRVLRLNTPVLDREGPDTVNSATITVLYAASTKEMREHLWAVAVLTGAGSFLLLAIATASTVWAVRKGLSPLAKLADSAGRVTAHRWNLDMAEEARTTRELAPLTAAMDSMLETLRQAFTSQREFLANAAHELKTPIAVLKSTLQLLLQQPRTANEYRVQAEAALEDLARLESLTHSMLRLARAEQRQVTQRGNGFPLIDIAARCQQSVERLSPVAESNCVTVQVHSDGPHSVQADPEDLELIWNNLFENAIRYSPRNSAIAVRISSNQQYVRIDVADTGPGIAATDLQDIFNRFHRADTSRSRETGGYGLGLAIVKTMVETYGGTISADSQVGVGTTMSVRLPIPT